jgi:hypothetical protein
MFDDSEISKIKATWKSEEHFQKIKENWDSFNGLLEQTGTRAPQLKEMLNHFGERACIAPASTRIEFHNAFPGGFIDHSLRVLRTAINISAALNVKSSKDSIIIAAALHDWGKVGTLDADYYVMQDSQWHNKQGQMYRKNDSIRMPNSQLGLFTMSQFGVKLSEDEYLSVLLNDGMYAEGNREYGMKEPSLALIVHWADRWSTQCEKMRTSLFDAAPSKL